MLERFRKSPVTDPDPQIRGEALLELGPADPAFVEALEGDDDAGVRARLLGAVTDLSVLQARLGKDDAGAVKEAAAARLRALLGANEECSDAARDAFVGACDDVGMLHYCALNAPALATRNLAFEHHADKAADDHVLLQVAVASREKEVSLQQRAERALDDEALLESLVARTKSDKVSHRFVRERLKAVRDRAAAVQELEALSKDLATRAAQSVPATSEALHKAVALHQQWTEKWTDVLASAEVDKPNVAADLTRINANLDSARHAIDLRQSILESVKTTAPDLDVEELREQWASIDDHSPRDVEQFEQGIIAWQTAQKKQVAAADKWDAAAALLERFDPEKEGKGKARSLATAWDALALPASDDDAHTALVARYSALMETLGKRDEAAEAAQNRALAQAEELLEKLSKALDEGQISAATSACDRLSHRLRTRANLPASAVSQLSRRLGVLSPRLQELKQARIWSTQQARQELITETEALALQHVEVDPRERADRIKALRTKWRALDHGVGPAHEDIWKRFDGACEAAYAPAKEHFEKESAERQKNAAAKRALCEELEALAKQTDFESPDWEALSKAVNSARRRWRDSGPVNHKQFQKLRTRFDAAIKPIEGPLREQSEREVRRRELAMASLEKAIANDPLDKQIDLAKRIQREWRPSVRAPRKKEQQMWDALRKICDGVFAQRDEKFATRKAAEDEAVTVRNTICSELEELACTDAATLDDAGVKALTASYSALKDRWHEAGNVHPKKRNALNSRYRDLCKRIDGVRREVKRRASAKQDEVLLKQLAMVDERWRALAAGKDVADQTEAFAALGAGGGPLGRKLASMIDAPAPTGKAATREQLCLRAELAADVDSPAEFASDRMKLKIELLNEAMAGGGTPSAREAVTLYTEQWLETALSGDDSDEATYQRFATALDALVHRR